MLLRAGATADLQDKVGIAEILTLTSTTPSNTNSQTHGGCGCRNKWSSHNLTSKHPHLQIHAIDIGVWGIQTLIVSCTVIGPKHRWGWNSALITFSIHIFSSSAEFLLSHGLLVSHNVDSTMCWCTMLCCFSNSSEMFFTSRLVEHHCILGYCRAP